MTVRRVGIGCAISALVWCVPAVAGEEVRYAEPAGWVIPADFAAAAATKEKLVLLDEQVRMERGEVTTYSDVAYRIDSPDMLTKMGTLTLNWSPDKGDLTIHRIQVQRGTETIDLLAQGAKYEVLRREAQLERRSLDGQLTATLAVPGLKVGDILRFSQTVSLRDQALGDDVQFSDGLLAKPLNLGFGRVRASWPKDLAIAWKAGPDVTLAEPGEQDGYKVLELALPIAKRLDQPNDAPARFTYGPLVQATTFENWTAVSQRMARHFQTDGLAPAGSPVAAEAAKIAARTSDPRERAAAALRLVQDEVSYLLNGMNGGNYLPQSPADTWANRFGDCKAKSLLLLTMLRAMDIDAEAVLVRSKAGDAVSAMLPMPADFDHMIVRAKIDGQDYWLDGTSTGTRLDTMAEVPAFAWALPIRAEGAELTAMTQRWPDALDRDLTVTYDYRAGLDLPVLYDAKVVLRGVMAAPIRTKQSEPDRDARLAFASEYFKDLVGEGIVYDAALSYDEESGVGTLTAKGLLGNDFEFERGRGSLALGTPGTNLEFKPDRARSAWATIPVAVGGPLGLREHNIVLLPKNTTKFEMLGTARAEETVAGVRLRREAALTQDRFELTDQTTKIPAEIAPADFARERAAAARFSAGDPILRTGEMPARYWTLEPGDLRARLDALEPAYTAIIDLAPDEGWRWALRASLFDTGADRRRALADYDKAIALEPSVSNYRDRASLRRGLGDLGGAVDDARAAYDLEGNVENAIYLANLLSRGARFDDALAVLDALDPTGDEEVDVHLAKGQILGDAGRADEGWELFAKAEEQRPGDANVLNQQCWFMGTLSYGLDRAKDVCDRAVTAGNYSADTLDSRALVNYRLGDRAAALADANAALSYSPETSSSLFLRGVIASDNGDKQAAGRDVEYASRLYGDIAQYFERYGIKAGK